MIRLSVVGLNLGRDALFFILPNSLWSKNCCKKNEVMGPKSYCQWINFLLTYWILWKPMMANQQSNFGSGGPFQAISADNFKVQFGITSFFLLFWLRLKQYRKIWKVLFMNHLKLVWYVVGSKLPATTHVSKAIFWWEWR